MVVETSVDSSDTPFDEGSYEDQSTQSQRNESSMQSTYSQSVHNDSVMRSAYEPRRQCIPIRALVRGGGGISVGGRSGARHGARISNDRDAHVQRATQRYVPGEFYRQLRASDNQVTAHRATTGIIASQNAAVTVVADNLSPPKQRSAQSKYRQYSSGQH